MGAADLLGCKPAEVVMVAAHGGDLKAARKCGLRTAFVARPLEFGPNGKPDIAPGDSFDLMTSDFVELISLL